MGNLGRFVGRIGDTSFSKSEKAEKAGKQMMDEERRIEDDAVQIDATNILHVPNYSDVKEAPGHCKKM